MYHLFSTLIHVNQITYTTDVNKLQTLRILLVPYTEKWIKCVKG